MEHAAEGLWPKKAVIGRLTPLSISIITMYLVFFMGTIVEVYRSLGDFLVITESLAISFLVGVTFHKYLMLIQYEGELKQLVSIINKYFFVDEQRHRSKHYEIVQAQDTYSRRLTLGFLVICAFTAIGFTLVPITEAVLYTDTTNSTEPYVWRFPYKISFPFDTSGNITYTIVYLYHIYVGLVHIFLIPACDNFIASLMCHVVGQFRILKDTLEHLRSYATAKVESMKYCDKEDFETVKGDDDEQWEEKHQRRMDTSEFYTSDEVHQEMHRAFSKCVRHHQTILQFVDALEHIVNRMMLSQFFASSMIFCTAAFHLTKPGKDKLMQMLSMGGLISGALLQLGMYCYFGDQVQEESALVAFAAYSAQWYHATPSIKRSIGIMMSRSQRPAMLSMGKFADLSLDTFATILRGSYAYFAMLNELNT